jgi:tRNA(His) 5'-end guanylyltransferase
MAGDGTALGNRMKMYEAATGSVLTRYLPFVIRVDVRAAHSLLRDANKPFDMGFVRMMGVVMERLCREVQGAVFAYQQSDEISVLACSYEDFTQQPWFGGRVQKIASVSAGIASVSLALQRMLSSLPATLAFDARVFALPNPVEVANYFVWRQRDAQRNAVSMAAQAHFSVPELYGKNRGQMVEMLRERGIVFDDYPASVRFGQICEPSPTASGSTWRPYPAEQFAAEPDNWLARWIPEMPSFGGPSQSTVDAAVREYFPPEVLRDLGRPELFHG